MKLFILKPITAAPGSKWEQGYDKMFSAVVRALDVKHAREIMAVWCGDEGPEVWTDKTQTLCVELEPAGNAGLVICDFHAA